MQVSPTSLPGVFLVDLDVFEDERGSFREAWQAEKMTAAGLPALQPVQLNISESKRGVIRGVHGEPWDKYVHVTFGRVFAAVVDLREDLPSFGMHATFELGPSKALFIPRGMGNSFQVLSDLAVYGYLVTEHWRAEAPYLFVAFDDPDLAIPWPLPKDEWIVSSKDRAHPTMRERYPDKFS